MALALALNDANCPLPQRVEAAERAVEGLIAFLDEVEGDHDLEDNGDDEPWLGWEHANPRMPDTSDCELDEADDEDEGTEEPTLGAPESHGLFVAALGFWHVKPHWLDRSQWLARLADRHCVRVPGGSQAHWTDGDNRFRADDCELVNEDGGNILDEAHDSAGEDDEENGDLEPFLSWPEAERQGFNLNGGPTFFDERSSGSFEAGQAARQQAKRLLGTITREEPGLEIVRVTGLDRYPVSGVLRVVSARS